MTTHLDQAHKALDQINNDARRVGMAPSFATEAIGHALIEIAEQLRVRNIIALADAANASEAYDDVTEATREAAYQLIDYEQIDPDDELPVIAKSIARSLRIGGNH